MKMKLAIDYAERTAFLFISYGVCNLNMTFYLYLPSMYYYKGPMSHSIRPDSYISMDNFYTATVYWKVSITYIPIHQYY